MYNYKDILTALNVLYVLGYNRLTINEFTRFFCNSEKLDQKYDPTREEPRINRILNQLDKQKKVDIKKGTIHLHKTYYCIARVDLTMSED